MVAGCRIHRGRKAASGPIDHKLAKALDACRRQKAKLVITKRDRLSRNLAFIATLMEFVISIDCPASGHTQELPKSSRGVRIRLRHR
jgi:hypothetical protein